MSTFKDIDYVNMPEDTFRHLYVNSIVEGDVVWGCIPEPAFDRACKILVDLGFTSIHIDRVIDDPEAIQTYVVSSKK